MKVAWFDICIFREMTFKKGFTSRALHVNTSIVMAHGPHKMNVLEVKSKRVFIDVCAKLW